MKRRAYLTKGGANERSERATRTERAGEAARERACGGVRGAKPLGSILTAEPEYRPERPADESEPAPAAHPEGAPAANDAAPAAQPPRRRRLVVRGLGILVAIVVGLIVASLTIDLGPALKKRAEDAGSKWLDRPMHIGKLGIHLGTGAFQLDDLVIDGLNPGDRPFLKARRVFVNLP